MAISIGINGFGRIGRVALRIAINQPDTFKVCGINVRNADLGYMKYESMRTDENNDQIDRFIQNFDLALTHPDDLDVEHAKVFVDHMLKKIQL